MKSKTEAKNTTKKDTTKKKTAKKKTAPKTATPPKTLPAGLHCSILLDLVFWELVPAPTKSSVSDEQINTANRLSTGNPLQRDVRCQIAAGCC